MNITNSGMQCFWDFEDQHYKSENFKNLGLGVLVILPFSPITIPYIFKKAQEYKVDIVPKWYKDITNENKEIK